MERIQIQRYQSPVGELLLGSFGARLCLCDWAQGKRHEQTIIRLQRGLQATYEIGNSKVTDQAASQLNEYFARRRKSFDIPLLFVGTEFQKSVWEKLTKIPYGVTLSYGEMAVQTGTPKAVRAIANATGANAISIFVPCHRIIGSKHTLNGYNGGLKAKRLLLEMEIEPRNGLLLPF